MAGLPERTRVYQHHHFDGTRWDYFAPRDDDVVIASSYKSGTTWTQAIVGHLIFAEEGLREEGRPRDLPAPLSQLSPWLDSRIFPLELVLNRLRAQRHRRFIKTHLPLDGLLFHPQLRYVLVARDGRDAFLSLWNHYSRHTEEAFAAYNRTPGRVGPEFPRPPPDLHALWREWTTRGWFPWEGDGWPYWSHLHHAATWWPFRQLQNVLFVHYADLQADTEREARRIAAFLGIALPESAWPAVVRSVTFEAMKKRGDRYAPGGGAFWKGGADTFLHRGGSGRWREVFSAEELALYDAACERVLPPACRRWLAGGGPVAPGGSGA